MRTSGQVSEKRTQIYLPNEMYKEAKKMAKRRGVSLAQIVREALEKKLPTKDVKKGEGREWKNLMKLAGIGKRGPSDVSKRTGEYFAEAVWQKMRKNRKK